MLNKPEKQREIGSEAGPMGARKTPGALIHFGEFTLDLERHGLYRGRERVHLTGKPFETLVQLVENSGQIVTKHDLLDKAWANLFVSENSLDRAITEIRRALGDDKENARFIQTVPRQVTGL